MILEKIKAETLKELTSRAKKCKYYMLFIQGPLNFDGYKVKWIDEKGGVKVCNHYIPFNELISLLK